MDPLSLRRVDTNPAILMVKIKARFTNNGVEEVDEIHDDLQNVPLCVFAMK